MNPLRRWAIPAALALLMGGCRITEDMAPGEKIALGFVYTVAAAALFALLLGVIFLASARS